MAQSCEEIAQLSIDLKSQGIHHLWSIEGQRSNAIVAFVEKIIVHRGFLLLSRAHSVLQYSPDGERLTQLPGPIMHRRKTCQEELFSASPKRRSSISSSAPAICSLCHRNSSIMRRKRCRALVPLPSLATTPR